jgi:hypothetical protein
MEGPHHIKIGNMCQNGNISLPNASILLKITAITTKSAFLRHFNKKYRPPCSTPGNVSPSCKNGRSTADKSWKKCHNSNIFRQNASILLRITAKNH